jgi:type II secretory pathway pseudopilin PulG
MANRMRVGDRASRPRGFTYVAVLIAVAVMSVGLLAISEMWVSVLNHQRLAQAEWVGHQYERAIRSYYIASTGNVGRLPMTLEELLEDHRYLTIRRHLRRLYGNPFQGGEIEPVYGGGQVGVIGVKISVPIELGEARLFVFNEKDVFNNP